MAENDSEVLTRDKAVPHGILPTGRKIGVIPVRGVTMYQIGYVDGKPGTIPDEYSSKFTSIVYAEREAHRFVSDFWDVSDKASSKPKNKTLSLSNNAVG